MPCCSSFWLSLQLWLDPNESKGFISNLKHSKEIDLKLKVLEVLSQRND